MAPSAPLTPRLGSSCPSAPAKTTNAGPIGLRTPVRYNLQAIYNSKIKSVDRTKRSGSNPPSSIGTIESVDGLRVNDGIRLGIFVLAFASVLLDTTRHVNRISGFYAAFLAAYFIFCVLVYFKRQSAWIGRTFRLWCLWVDVAIWILLFLTNSSANALLIFGLMFAIRRIAFEFGSAMGIQATVMALTLMLLQTVIRDFWFNFGEPSFQQFSFLSVALLGVSLSWWGGTEKLNRERFELIGKICNLSNPRFGIDRTLCAITSELQRFYKVDEGLLVLFGDGVNNYSLYRATQAASPDSINSEKVESKFGEKLLSLPSSVGAVYCEKGRALSIRKSRSFGLDVDTLQSVGLDREELKTIADLLDTSSYLTVPFRISSVNLGRIYLLSNGRSVFGEGEIRFVSQVVESVLPGIENIRLVDRLASAAAEHEREKIALDLHDTTIQPFIGLKLGLSAIRQKLDRGEGNVADDVSKLIGFADAELGELRQYVSGLKGSERTCIIFRDAVERFIEKFSDASSIKVELSISEQVKISDRLAAEVFQLIAEGLSNVRRHSGSSRALVELTCKNEHLVLIIENDSSREGNELSSFLPRSICERSSAIGGHVDVFHAEGGVTKVHISIPI